ncbi:hypothetical protein PR048_019191 [Dryococelus australis]|uniref:Uncharacterized protein n=1 Tax=Dryococelus australis TaxID=614101 RepID=A0ABQ9H2T0_9NEOP|nr:hypothetical protein PR048_019191 [Dryococelus australis]
MRTEWFPFAATAEAKERKTNKTMKLVLPSQARQMAVHNSRYRLAKRLHAFGWPKGIQSLSVTVLETPPAKRKRETTPPSPPGQPSGLAGSEANSPEPWFAPLQWLVMAIVRRWHRICEMGARVKETGAAGETHSTTRSAMLLTFQDLQSAVYSGKDACRSGAHGMSRFPPAMHSGATAYPPRFTLIGPQDLDETTKNVSHGVVYHKVSFEKCGDSVWIDYTFLWCGHPVAARADATWEGRGRRKASPAVRFHREWHRAVKGGGGLPSHVRGACSRPIKLQLQPYRQRRPIHSKLAFSPSKPSVQMTGLVEFPTLLFRRSTFMSLSLWATYTTDEITTEYLRIEHTSKASEVAEAKRSCDNQDTSRSSSLQTNGVICKPSSIQGSQGVKLESDYYIQPTTGQHGPADVSQFANQRQVTYPPAGSPVNRETSAARNSQSENGCAHDKATATSLRLCELSTLCCRPVEGSPWGLPQRAMRRTFTSRAVDGRWSGEQAPFVSDWPSLNAKRVEFRLLACPVSPPWFKIRSEIRYKIDTENCCTIRVRARLEVEMKLISNRRNWRFEISIRDQQPSVLYSVGVTAAMPCTMPHSSNWRPATWLYNVQLLVICTLFRTIDDISQTCELLGRKNVSGNAVVCLTVQEILYVVGFPSPSGQTPVHFLDVNPHWKTMHFKIAWGGEKSTHTEDISRVRCGHSAINRAEKVTASSHVTIHLVRSLLEETHFKKIGALLLEMKSRRPTAQMCKTPGNWRGTEVSLEPSDPALPIALPAGGRGGWAVSLLALHRGETGSSTRPSHTGFSQMGIAPDDAAGPRIFYGVSRSPSPFHSGAAPFSPHLTIIGSQDLVKSRPNLSTQRLQGEARRLRSK